MDKFVRADTPELVNIAPPEESAEMHSHWGDVIDRLLNAKSSFEVFDVAADFAVTLRALRIYHDRRSGIGLNGPVA